MDVHRVQSSCGFSIPFFDYVGERDTLKDYFASKSDDQAESLRSAHAAFSKSSTKILISE